MKITLRRAIGWLLALITVVTVVVNEQDVGIARDEVVYMNAGARYAHWWLSFGKGGILPTFGGALGGPGNPEHPPLVKTLAGVSHQLLHDDLHFGDDLTTFRLPSALLHGLCVLLVYFMVLELWGMAEAVIAALCLLLLPRALFHAGLTCFDAPIMALWFATIYAYWRALDGRSWPWQVGVAWGLALATKHTALLLPIALAVHYAVVAWRARDALVGWRIAVSLVVLGPLVLFALWPLLWLDPIGHVRDWINFHLHHVHYNYEYLGHNWNAPRFPWHVALVTTLFTVPVATLAAAFAGAGAWGLRWWRNEAPRTGDRARAPGVLLLVSLAASMGPFLLGSTPIFGAEKHWMPALPTIAIGAGVGAVWAARQATAALRAWRPQLREQLVERIAIGVVGGAIALAGVTETVTAHPYALTWYNALAGGAPGGADLGMNRQFWGVAARGVLPVIAEQLPGPVYTHDASPAWGWYQKLGLLPGGHPDSGWEVQGVSSSKLALVIHEKHFNRHDYLIWNAYGTVQPIFVLRADGVPIVSVYRRP
jgi:4-amino-4-deoxy-L-arabinose transferase-like glycosyltransferase